MFQSNGIGRISSQLDDRLVQLYFAELLRPWTGITKQQQIIFTSSKLDQVAFFQDLGSYTFSIDERSIQRFEVSQSGAAIACNHYLCMCFRNGRMVNSKTALSGPSSQHQAAAIESNVLDGVFIQDKLKAATFCRQLL